MTGGKLVCHEAESLDNIQFLQHESQVWPHVGTDILVCQSIMNTDGRGRQRLHHGRAGRSQERITDSKYDGNLSEG